jgi:hypothetical protein
MFMTAFLLWRLPVEKTHDLFDRRAQLLRHLRLECLVS